MARARAPMSISSESMSWKVMTAAKTAPRPKTIEKLESFVESGGGLVMFVGDQVATEALAKVGAAACTCPGEPCECVSFECENEEFPAQCVCSHTVEEHPQEKGCEAKGEGIHRADCPVHGLAANRVNDPPADGSALAEDPGPDGDHAEPFPDGDAA